MSLFPYKGPKPKVTQDAFEDLLGGHSFAKKNEPRTMKEMRKDETKITDPEVLKVSQFTDFGLVISFIVTDFIQMWSRLRACCLISLRGSYDFIIFIIMESLYLERQSLCWKRAQVSMNYDVIWDKHIEVRSPEFFIMSVYYMFGVTGDGLDRRQGA